MMRMVVIAVVLAIASPARAQTGATPQAGQQVAGQERREKIKKRIRALRAYTLTEELSLDEKTAGKLFPLLSKYDDEFDKLLVARVDLEKRLQTAGDSSDGKAIDKLIDEAAANQKSLWDTELKRLAELRKILTPQQVARTLVVLPKMERQIQNQLRKAAAAKQPKAQAQPVDPYDNEDALGDPYAQPPKKKKAAKAAKGAESGELTKNPFAAPRKDEPCDPFSSLQGCAKK
jgi:Spy/CpxP family protein refolding chaperone